MSMDVSRVDPEEVLVDFQTLEPGDVSGDIDENQLPTAEYGKEDKVLVSIRYVCRIGSLVNARSIDLLGFAQRSHRMFGTFPFQMFLNFFHSTLKRHLPLPPNSTLTKCSQGPKINQYTMPLREAMCVLRWKATTPSYSRMAKLLVGRHSRL